MFMFNNVKYQNSYIVSNIKNISEEFISVLERLRNQQDDPDGFTLTWSNDQYHQKNKYISVIEEQLYEKGIQLSPKYGIEGIQNTITMGRGYTLRGNPLDIHPYSVEGRSISDGEFYVNSKGKVFPSCDLSFDVQDDTNLVIGDVSKSYGDFVKMAKTWNERTEGESMKVDEFYDNHIENLEHENTKERITIST